MEISKKWFSKKILCGIGCNHMCCKSPSFRVEFSKDEIDDLSKKYNKSLNPTEYQNGCCSHLKDDDTGCSFGDDKPKWCKVFPIVENSNNRLVLSNWSWLHCPKPNDYILDRIEDGKWYYKLKKRHKNKLDQVILNDDIENVIPNFFEREDIQGVLNER